MRACKYGDSSAIEEATSAYKVEGEEMLITTDMLMRRLHIGRQSAMEIAKKSGAIVRIGRSVRIKPDRVNAWLESRSD